MRLKPLRLQFPVPIANAHVLKLSSVKICFQERLSQINVLKQLVAFTILATMASSWLEIHWHAKFGYELE
jgi:hypothetical protein